MGFDPSGADPGMLVFCFVFKLKKGKWGLNKLKFSL